MSWKLDTKQHIYEVTFKNMIVIKYLSSLIYSSSSTDNITMNHQEPHISVNV